MVRLDVVREFVKLWQRRTGKTKAEFADMMGISAVHLWRVLTEKQQPGAKFIEGLLRAGLKPEEFMGRESNE